MPITSEHDVAAAGRVQKRAGSVARAPADEAP